MSRNLPVKAARFLPVLAGAGPLLVALPAYAIPSNFGSPFNPPRGMVFNMLEAQVQSDRSWDLALGGAYGLTRHIAPDWSFERTSTGQNVLGLGAGTAGAIAGFYAKFGVTASKVLGTPLGPSYSQAMDWGRPLIGGLATFGEIGGGLSQAAPGLALAPGFNYSQDLEIALTSALSLDVEYLGGLSAAGRSEYLCSDLTAALGRTYLTATVMLPRAPQAAPPVYLITTDFSLWP